jgi:hypothetical protein
MGRSASYLRLSRVDGATLISSRERGPISRDPRDASKPDMVLGSQGSAGFGCLPVTPTELVLAS